MSLTISPAAAVPAALHVPAPPMAMPPSPGEMAGLAQRRHVSPLVIADQLITLAEQADRAGFPVTASSLVQLVFAVLDEHGGVN